MLRIREIVFVLGEKNQITMIKQGLLNEFNYEAENTRKLLRAIPNSALDYRPQPHLWAVGQLA